MPGLEIKGYCDKAGKHPSQYKVGDQPLIMNGDVCFMREVQYEESRQNKGDREGNGQNKCIGICIKGASR